MIKFNNLNKEIPYLIYKDKYTEALEAGQRNIEAISISSYNKDSNQVDSRFVNLKFIDNYLIFKACLILLLGFLVQQGTISIIIIFP